MLENGYLDDMNTQILNDLASFVQERQGMKLPVSRSGILTEMAVERQTDWLESLDLPQPKIRPPRIWKVRSPRVYPDVLPPPSKKGKGKASERKIAIGSALDSRDQDDMFEMEEDIAPPVVVTTSQRKPAAGVLAGTPAVETLTKGTPWRSSAVDTAKKFVRRIVYVLFVFANLESEKVRSSCYYGRNGNITRRSLNSANWCSWQVHATVCAQTFGRAPGFRFCYTSTTVRRQSSLDREGIAGIMANR
jgi:hypothetical protein